jgi:hypothetical protein
MPQRTVISMRCLSAGLILLLISSAAPGQISGFVESIGFNNAYRPDCFTPMIVQIKPTAGAGGLYYIQVKQYDLQGDEDTFTRAISITGDESTGPQRFSMYFLPTASGLPDTQSLRDLQKELKVFLLNKQGKQVASLPVTATLMNVDPPRGPWGAHRGRHLILSIAGNGSMPAWSEWQDEQSLLGVMEDAYVVQMSVRDLPENPVAYDAVDTVVWDNVDPADLKRGGDDKFRALETFVRRGGHLVICQSAQWQQYMDFGELLPVTLQGIDAKKDLQPLHEMSGWTGTKPATFVNPQSHKEESANLEDPWEKVKGPFTFARAQAKPGAIVDDWMQWDDKNDRTPYIVRKPYGLGAVTWVAQDLGDTSITSYVKVGWAKVWNHVFDWKNPVIVLDKYTPDRDKYAWAHGGTVDIGGQFVDPKILNHQGTVSSLVALAVAFFIIYWVVAGPGVFAYLVNRRRQNLSWFGFTLSAMVATLVTVLIVRLVVRGPPKLAHSSVVEQAAGQPALVRSEFGLYIKRDGEQHIEVKDSLPNAITTLTPLPIHPDYLHGEIDSTSAIEYDVPVRDVATEDPPALNVYYRNTSKKFQTNWIGQTGGKIDGSAKLVETRLIDGILTNATGQRLQDVYFAFKYPGDVTAMDWVLWKKAWEPGVSIDLGKEFYLDDKGDRPAILNPQEGIRPNTGKADRIKAAMQSWQDLLWDPMLKSKASVSGEGVLDDVRESYVLVSFFDRLKPLYNDDPNNQTRVELIRRGARHLDRSASIAAGALVIIARSSGDLPMPVPLEVEGEKITGDGPVYYQFVLPLDRSGLEAAASTQPAPEQK